MLKTVDALEEKAVNMLKFFFTTEAVIFAFYILLWAKRRSRHVIVNLNFDCR